MQGTEARGTTPFDPEELTTNLSALRDELTAAVERAGRQLEIERRMRENPMAVLGISAGIGFLLGGGLWPVLRPLLKAVARGALSPANLVGIAAALGAMRASEASSEPAGS